MAHHAVKNSRLHSAPESLPITSFTGGVDLKTSRPGYTTSAPGFLPRQFFFPVAGDIVIVWTNGISSTHTVTAGCTRQWNGVVSITEAGTTITECDADY